MIGIVWYYTSKEKGIQKIQSIKEEYQKIHINVEIKITSYDISLYCENGDIWKMYKASDCSRGASCNIGLIEYGTPKRIVNEIIKPCIKAFPYRAYNYY